MITNTKCIAHKRKCKNRASFLITPEATNSGSSRECFGRPGMPGATHVPELPLQLQGVVPRPPSPSVTGHCPIMRWP